MYRRKEVVKTTARVYKTTNKSTVIKVASANDQRDAGGLYICSHLPPSRRDTRNTTFYRIRIITTPSLVRRALGSVCRPAYWDASSLAETHHQTSDSGIPVRSPSSTRGTGVTQLQAPYAWYDYEKRNRSRAAANKIAGEAGQMRVRVLCRRDGSPYGRSRTRCPSITSSGIGTYRL
jgi:hypothetical protein